MSEHELEWHNRIVDESEDLHDYAAYLLVEASRTNEADPHEIRKQIHLIGECCGAILIALDRLAVRP